jgi:tripartite-type tricarboxylate transporter receptor subunit TctC
MTTIARILAWTALAIALSALPAAAQNYPNRPIRIVVPYPPGGGPDILSRAIGERLTQSWGQPFVVENKPGAGTVIGTMEVLRSPADGHTILVTDDATMTINPFIYKNLQYDPEKDFVAITQLVRFYQVLMATPSLPANDLKEVIAYAKANPGKLSYGSYGIGTTAHLSGEQIKEATGIDMIHVPYKGAESVMGAMMGNVQFAFAGMVNARSAIGGGKLKGIAIGGPRRSPFLPDVKTFAEQGYPTIDTSVSFGVFVRRGTPPEIIDKISRDFVATLMTQQFQDKFLKPVDFQPVGSSSQDFTALLKQIRETRGHLIAKAGIAPQ